MNNNPRTDLDQLITLALSLSIPEQARLCDALLESLEALDACDSLEGEPDPAHIAESERTLAAIDEALAELPTDTKLQAFVEHVEAKLAATQRDV